MKKKALFWSKNNNLITCNLCNHNCVIKENQTGICGVRKNENHVLYTLIYGSSSSIAADPIEKKPLFHFFPGSNALSLGTIGCNFKCLHCQNFSISSASPENAFLSDLSIEDILVLLKKYSCEGVAWTYNEPTIWYEFIFDASDIIKKEGYYNVLVTNGFISEDPLREIFSSLNAINVDIKSFSNDFYKKICKAKIEPVLNTCKIIKENDIILEITYLVIPGYNDSSNEIRQFCNWVINNLGIDTPVHFTRFHPDYKLQHIPRTSMEKMNKIYNIAEDSGLLYFYLGNIPSGIYEDTICPRCGNKVIERKGFHVVLDGIKKGFCSNCGNKIYGKF
jgi:pyruvate formate lyase activating enzyme